MESLAHPTRFLAVSQRLLPWVAASAGVLIMVGLYLGLVVSPPDYQQKDSVRIMYIHVPSAWMAMFTYAFMAVASMVGFVWKHPLADLAAKAAAPIGVCFTVLALITGSIWGKPTWGAWWVWDARLTSVVVLLFLYLGYLALWQTIDEPQRAARAAAILAMVGLINLPIIHYSVELWSTLHQPASVLKLSGPTIHSSILVPLLVMAGGFTMLFVALLLVRIRLEVLRWRLRVRQLARGRG